MILAVICVVGCAGILFLRGRMQKGVPLYPLRETEAGETVYFRQQDDRWAQDRLGTARDTMASSGCLVCALAAGLDMQAARLGLDFYMTAGELNEALGEASAYTDSGAVIWGSIPAAVSGTESYVADSVKAEEIDAFLEQGIFPVVKVRVNGVGAWHWVLITGTDADGYLCMDPMAEEETPVSLSAFQDRVYSVRAVYFTGQ